MIQIPIIMDEEVLKAKRRVEDYAKSLTQKEILDSRKEAVLSGVCAVVGAGFSIASILTDYVQFSGFEFAWTGVMLAITGASVVSYKYKQKNFHNESEKWKDAILYAVSHMENPNLEVWNVGHTRICPNPSHKSINEYFDWWTENQTKYGEMDKAVKRFKKYKLKREKCMKKRDKLVDWALKKEEERFM